MARTAQVAGVRFVRELDGIEEYRLESNDLQILLAQDLSSPVAGCMITYHVGSRNEAIGYTGSTHLLEHLMFKESKNYNEANKRPLKWYLDSLGAQMNATTWNDRTNYYQILLPELLFEAIAVEADRMRNLYLTEKDRADEMPIVRNEYERIMNSPERALNTEIWATAYQAHPYHLETIGWRSDIENVSIERLQQFYDDFYWPNNATLSIAGNFDTKAVLTHIQEQFGLYTRAPKEFPKMYTTEPLQEGERRLLLKRAGVNTVCIAYKTPEAAHPDMPALVMLSHILSGTKTSRLYRALVDTAKVTSIDTVVWQFRDPALFEIFASVAPQNTHADIEKGIKKELTKVIEKGITATELAHAKRAVRMYVASRRDGAYAFLDSLNEDIACGDWTRFVTFPEALQKVTAKDIQRVAKKYFVEDQSTVGWFINTAA